MQTCHEQHGFLHRVDSDEAACFCNSEIKTEIEGDPSASHFLPDLNPDDDAGPFEEDYSLTKQELEEDILSCGIPRHHRPSLWRRLLKCESLCSASSFDYQASVQKIRNQLDSLGISEVDSHKAQLFLGNSHLHQTTTTEYVPGGTLRQIFCDVERTFPDHELFHPSQPGSQDHLCSLFRILAAYAMYNHVVGYCQGMSHIAGVLLMHMGEQHAFWCLVSLMESQCYLFGCFEQPLSRIKHYGAIFGELLQTRLPQLHTHLERLKIDPLMYLTPWFMSLFTHLPCWRSVLCVWDLFILKGISALFRVAMATLELCQADLVSSDDLAYVMPHLLKPPSKVCRCDVLMTAVTQTTIDQWEIDSWMSIVVGRDGSQRKRRASGDRTCTERTVPKRRKVKGSIFTRVSNIFTPKTTNTRSPLRTIRRNHSSKTLIGQHLLKKYIRHSSRAKLTLKSFSASQPLRPSQIDNVAAPSKADVELQEFVHKTTESDNVVQQSQTNNFASLSKHKTDVELHKFAHKNTGAENCPFQSQFKTASSSTKHISGIELQEISHKTKGDENFIIHSHKPYKL